MITEQAAHELLEGLNADDADMNCYCANDVCDASHPADEGLGRPRFGLAFVVGGQLDQEANQEAYGTDHGSLVQDAEDVVIELKDYAEYIDELVVIDRETGQWWAGADFSG